MSPTPTGPQTPQSAEPSVLARWLAFGSIVLAGAAGGFIGWSFADLQCEGDCTTAAGITALVTAVGAAVGVGIVAVLALRALGEWQSQQARSSGQSGSGPGGSEPAAGEAVEGGLVLRRKTRTRPTEPPDRRPRVQ